MAVKVKTHITKTITIELNEAQVRVVRAILGPIPCYDRFMDQYKSPEELGREVNAALTRLITDETNPITGTDYDAVLIDLHYELAEV